MGHPHLLSLQSLICSLPDPSIPEAPPTDPIHRATATPGPGEVKGRGEVANRNGEGHQTPKPKTGKVFLRHRTLTKTIGLMDDLIRDV
eukprot:7736185-Pyramimonas_sp.AAC.1